MKTKKKNYYWTDKETKLLYTALNSDGVNRDVAWSKLQRPLYKLIDAVYHIGKFYNLEVCDTKEAIYTDCITHIYTALRNFKIDHTKSTFAYLQTTIHYYLVARIKDKYPKVIRNRDVYKTITHFNNIDDMKDLAEEETQYSNTSDTIINHFNYIIEDLNKKNPVIYCQAVIDFLTEVPGAYKLSDINKYVANNTNLTKGSIMYFSRKFFGKQVRIKGEYE